MTPTGAARATVYIPTLTGGPKLEACLSSLAAQTVPVRVVVADNGEGEGCARMIEERFDRVERVAMGRNLGFGPALNRAIARAGEGPVILLNDDAVADPGFTEALLDAWNGEVAMVAAVMLDAGGDRIDSAGIVADETLAAHDYLNGRPAAAADSAPPPLGPTGGGALYDRAAFEAAGGFDERIFLYYEDLDLALRIRMAGGACRLAPRARATHGYSETLGARSSAKYGYTGWSRGYVLRKYGVMKDLRRAARVVVSEGVVCAAQLVADRTAAGLTGRIRGWRASRATERLPVELLERSSLRRWLRLKVGRRFT